MVVKLQNASRIFESEPYVPVTLADGTVVRDQCPDLVVERLVIVELKAHIYTLSHDEQAQVIGYFAALPECPVALYLNFGRPRLEFRRLFHRRRCKHIVVADGESKRMSTECERIAHPFIRFYPLPCPAKNSATLGSQLPSPTSVGRDPCAPQIETSGFRYGPPTQ